MKHTDPIATLPESQTEFQKAREALQLLPDNTLSVNGLTITITDIALGAFRAQVVEDAEGVIDPHTFLDFRLVHLDPPQWQCDEPAMELTFIRQYGIDEDWSLEFLDL